MRDLVEIESYSCFSVGAFENEHPVVRAYYMYLERSKGPKNSVRNCRKWVIPVSRVLYWTPAVGKSPPTAQSRGGKGRENVHKNIFIAVHEQDNDKKRYGKV